MDSSCPEGNLKNQGLFAGLIDIIFPGLSYLPHAAIALMFVKYIAESWGHVLSTRLLSTVEIRAHDDTYNYLMTWVAKNSLSRENHRLLASSTITNEEFAWNDGTTNNDDREFETAAGEEDIQAGDIAGLRSKISLYNARPLRWTPAMGLHFFRFENRIVAFTRAFEDRETLPYARRAERLFISCLGTDAGILKRIVTIARLEYLESERGKISIYRGTKISNFDMTWTKAMSRAARPMSTIALDESIKEHFVQDLQRYLNPKTKTWYATRGIPYRRGYLFSGPPGTGKTSLTLAAAGLMGLDIYMINLNSPSLTEDSLSNLFQSLPRTCVVLLEDVDAAGITHKRAQEPEDGGDAEPSQGQQRRERISLSALLNVIDGVAAQEGRVLVMTSNHTDKIDPALLRPGRVDFSIRFGLATSGTVHKIFKQMFDASDIVSEPCPIRKSISADSDQHGSSEKLELLSQQQNAVEELKVRSTTLDALAEEFVSKVPELEFSPAAIQGFLLTHQNDPMGAVSSVEEWVQRQRIGNADPGVNSPRDVQDSDANTTLVHTEGDAERDTSNRPQ